MIEKHFLPNFVIIFFTLTLYGCSIEPSESVIQTAIAKTKIAQDHETTLNQINSPEPQTASVTPTKTEMPPTETREPTLTVTSTVIPPTETEEPTSTCFPLLEYYDFENQNIAVPHGLLLKNGAEIVEGSTKHNKILLDETVSYSGGTSMKISSNYTTEQWDAIWRPIPSSAGRVLISYYIKGKNIQKEGNQFSNCYIGFWSTDSAGNKELLRNDYLKGTFDWEYGELELSTDMLGDFSENDTNIEFMIFCSVSGELWIDDLKIEIYPRYP